MTNPPVWIWDLGTVAYTDAWNLQNAVLDHRASGELPYDVVMLLEHPHVFTVGRRGGREHIIEPIDSHGQPVPVFDVDRGGDITYHGPGQLVVYPILGLNLFANDVLRYLRFLETVVVTALSRLGVSATTNPPFTGVWTNGRKIASLGVAVQRGITKHGFALNYSLDLSFFQRIIPCGLHWVTMTSIDNETGKTTLREAVVDAICESMSVGLSCPTSRMPHEWQYRALSWRSTL
ncbi:MAG: lipoyl(octanoyl) transferase LipB [Myxococcales bacterium]|nr:lipoyl(octanoyl) transferase LipB [Myxococcales bacterium]